MQNEPGKTVRQIIEDEFDKQSFSGKLFTDGCKRRVLAELDRVGLASLPAKMSKVSYVRPVYPITDDE
jgi:hypothetical protein